MKYYIRTQTTVKERDRGKWWMDSDMICPKTIEADNLPQLLELYREAVSDMVSISDNAIKNKNAMYIDLPNGEYKQVGYVITGKTYFEDLDINYSKEHWTKIEFGILYMCKAKFCFIHKFFLQGVVSKSTLQIHLPVSYTHLTLPTNREV